MKRIIMLGMIGCVAGCVPVDPLAGQATDGCLSDADCSDGIFCNGIESCFNGLCFAGNAPCPNLVCDDQLDVCIAIADDDGIDCPPICIADLCDSDCDGWFDSVEIEVGLNPCDPFDTEFCPSADVAARVCDHIVGCDSLNEPDNVFNEPVDTFVSGDVFSFLTPTETDVFLSLVVSNNIAIDELVDAELSLVLADLQNRGLSGSSLVCGAKCEAEKNRVRLKRQATAIAVDQVLVASRRFVDFTALAEIESFNCREYPNTSFVCSSPTGLPPLTCTIDLPCL